MPESASPRGPVAEVELSVVVPVRDAEASLVQLLDRLYEALDALGRAYEVVFVDAASRDRGPTLLRQQHRLRPDRTRVLFLGGGSDTQAALAAGLAASSGRRVVVLPAQLDAAVEAIAPLLTELERGHDLVVAEPSPPQVPTWAEVLLGLSGRLRDGILGGRVVHWQSRLQAYDRTLVDAVLACDQGQTPILALANRLAVNARELRLAEGQPEAISRRLARDFDVVIHRSLVPLWGVALASLGGCAAALGGALYLALTWAAGGSEGAGLSGILAVLFGLVGLLLFGMALVAAYLARLLEQTQGRLPHRVREELVPRPAGRPTP